MTTPEQQRHLNKAVLLAILNWEKNRNPSDLLGFCIGSCHSQQFEPTLEQVAKAVERYVELGVIEVNTYGHYQIA